MTTDVDYLAGAQAFKDGKRAAEGPFSFKNTPAWPNDYERFNRDYRARMNSWMRGWLDAQKDAK